MRRRPRGEPEKAAEKAETADQDEATAEDDPVDEDDDPTDEDQPSDVDVDDPVDEDDDPAAEDEPVDEDDDPPAEDEPADEAEPDADGADTEDPSPPPRKRWGARAVSRAAVEQVVEMTGRHPEGVTSVSRTDEGWMVEVEVVETQRIPDSADVLATYQTELDEDAELMSYRRVRRYMRGSGDDG